MMKRTVPITAAIVVLVLAGCVVAAGWFVHSHRFQRLLLAKVNQAIAGKITVDSLDLSLIKGRAALSEIRLLDDHQAVVAYAKHCRVSIAWMPLLRRQVAVTTLHIDGLELDLVIDEQGRANIAQALSLPSKNRPLTGQAEKKGSPWQMRVEDVQLRDGHIHFDQPARHLEGRAGPVAITGRFDSSQLDGLLDLTVGTLSFKGLGIDRSIVDVRLRADHRSNRPHPWNIALTTPDVGLSAQGQVRLEKHMPVLDAVLKVQGDLVELQRWLPQPLGLAGHLAATAQIDGALADPRIDLECNLSQAQVGGVQISALSADAVLQDRRVTLEKLHGDGPWGRLQLIGTIDLNPVFPKGLLDPPADLSGLTYDLIVRADHLQPWNAADLPLKWIGTWQGQVKVNGRGLPGLAANTGRGDAQLSVAGIRIAPGGAPIDGTVNTRVQWDGALVSVLQSRFGIPDHVLEAKGRIDFGQMQLDATGRLSSQQIAMFGRALGIPLPQGHAEVNLTAAGALTHPVITANMLARDLRLGDNSFGRLLVTAQMDSAYNLRFPRLVLENKGSYLQGQGRLLLSEADPAVGLELDFDHLEPADFMAMPDMKAWFNGHLTVSGSLKDPLGRLHLDPSTLSRSQYHAVVQGDASWRRGRVDIPGIDIALAGSLAHIKGDVTFRDPRSGHWHGIPSVHLTMRADALHLEDFKTGLKGLVSTTVELEGPLTDPNGRFSVDGRRIATPYQKIAAVQMDGRIGERTVYFDQFSLNIDDESRMTGNGRLGFDRSFAVQLNGDQIDLGVLQALQGANPVHGRLTFELHGQGNFQHPVISADVAINQPMFGDQPLGDFKLRAKLDGRRLWLDGKMNFDITADCDVAAGDFSVKAAFAQTDLSPLLSLIGGDTWQGHLSGKVDASGNWHHWQQIRAAVDLDQLDLFFKQQRLVELGGLHLTLRDRTVHLPQTRIVILKTGHLNIMAEGDMDHNLSLTADGRVPVSALGPFLGDPDEIGGEIAIKADAHGPWDHIQWRIETDSDHVRFEVPYIAQVVHDLSGHLLLTPDRVTISDVAGKIETGGFKLDGDIQLDRLKPVAGQLVLNLDSLPLQVPDTMDVTLGGRLSLKGDPDRAVLGGNLILLGGTYYKDLKLNLWSLVTETRRTQSVPQTIERPAWMDNIALEVELTYRYPFQVANNVANIDIVPDLKITGTMAKPLISGRASVSQGEVVFRGKSFPVTRGVVDFINPNRIQPELDILSETKIRDWNVSLSVTGTPDQLVLHLNSSPPLAENDILSLILFGRTNSELASGPGGGSATTGQMLAGLLATALGEEVKKTTGVDILEVDTGAQSDTDSADRIQVTVGKNLTPRITVKYEVESNNGELIQRAVSEYRFSEQVLASGFQDTKGRYGAELLFRFEFR